MKTKDRKACVCGRLYPEKILDYVGLEVRYCGAARCKNKIDKENIQRLTCGVCDSKCKELTTYLGKQVYYCGKDSCIQEIMKDMLACKKLKLKSKYWGRKDKLIQPDYWDVLTMLKTKFTSVYDASAVFTEVYGRKPTIDEIETLLNKNK